MRTGSSPMGAALAEAAGARLPAPAGHPGALQDAAVRALAYADVFDYPLTAREVHRYLDTPATPGEVALALAAAGTSTRCRDARTSLTCGAGARSQRLRCGRSRCATAGCSAGCRSCAWSL